jgi:hypothetical protein
MLRSRIVYRTFSTEDSAGKCGSRRAGTPRRAAVSVRSRVTGNFIVVRHQRTLGENLEGRRVAPHFGRMAGAPAGIATVRKEGFDDPVLE